ncbi:MAG: AAA family ATPase [Deltaproteobacteria bacterium]|nr:AAA family ATPase [Myxococcales bacterium]MDP3216481.1 AAA family ATPase [Deltaproteobacteria bacterium]
MNPRIEALCGGWDPARASDPVALVLATGRTDDRFFLHAPARLETLRDALEQTCRGAVRRFVSYSQTDGLRDTGRREGTAEGADAPAGGTDPRDIARAAARAAAARVGATGRLRFDPLGALLEVDAALREGVGVLALIEGVGVWEPVSEDRPDVLAAMQGWIDLCRSRGSRVVFAGHRPSERLRRLFAGRPGVREVTVGGPPREEITDWLVTSEVNRGRPECPPLALGRVADYLRGVGELPGNGLATIARSLGGERGPLDAAWLKSQGAVSVDPADVDVEGMRAHLESNIIGQRPARAAVLRMAEGVRMRGLGSERRRPIWRALFAGPAGVGKTELAKVLSRFFYESERCCLIACTEFQQEHEVAKLLGAPPGYVGYGDPGMLREFLARNRAGVLIFDEFEKAHETLHKAVMGLLEEGTLTTGDGSTLRFHDCIVIATTNEGSDAAARLREERPEASPEEQARVYEEALLRRFRDYGLRRFDARIVFEPLGEEELAQVAAVHIARRIELERTQHAFDAEAHWGPALVRAVLREADPRLGAGEIRNVVDRVVGDLLVERYYRLRPRPASAELDP